MMSVEATMSTAAQDLTTSLRERNKLKKRVAVIKATRELLLNNGYEKMTMEAIAQRAEVGVATVYKYFGTKDGLVMELANGDLADVLENIDRVVADPPANLPDAMVALLAPALDMPLARGGSNLVRYILNAAWVEESDKHGDIARWAMAEMKLRIKALLVHFQGRGEFEKSANPAEAAGIIFALIDYNYIRFSRGELKTVEQMAELTNRQVRMLFDNWRCQQPLRS